MDLLQIIILWLKSFIEAMKRITSFVGGSYLPDETPDKDDDYNDKVHLGRPTIK